jgi:DNA-binding transcriptional LysR family regulator
MAADRYKDIQLPQLRSFCLLASESSFTSVAKALGMAVPTIWIQVRSLERKLGTMLLRREGRRVELTEDGRLLLELIQPHVTGLDSLERLFKARKVETPQKLTIASAPYLFTHYLPEPIREFATRYPAVRLNLSIQWSDAMGSVVRLLERRKADVGMIVYYRSSPPSRLLEYEDLLEQRLMLVTRPNHPLARKRRVQPRDLIPYPILTGPPESYYRIQLDRVLQQHGLAEKVQVTMESPSMDIIRQYAALGMGVGVVYGGNEISRATPGLSIRPFDPSVERLSVATAVLKGAHLPEAAHEFRRLARECLSPQ